MMLFELIFELIDVKTDKQIGFLGLNRRSIITQEPFTGVPTKVLTGDSWLIAGMDNRFISSGEAVFQVNRLILKNPKDGDMTVNNFSFADTMNNSSKYEIKELKDGSLSYIIHFRSAQNHAAVFPNVASSRMAIS